MFHNKKDLRLYNLEFEFQKINALIISNNIKLFCRGKKYFLKTKTLLKIF